jgi:retron-type reverse transcriptase
VMGDLNSDLMKPNDNPGKALIRSLSLAGTRIISTEPTRITSTSATCLDIIAIDDSINCTEYIIGDILASDHLPVAARIEASTVVLKPIIKRSFKKVDFTALCVNVAAIDLEESVPCDTNTMLERWHSSLLNLINDVAPVKNFPMRKHRSPWINSEVRQLMKQRDSLARILKSNRSQENMENIKIAKRRVKSKIRQVAREEGTAALQSKNPTEAWSFIKRATFTTKGGEETHLPLAVLNDYFASIVQAKGAQTTSQIQTCDTEDGFEFSPIHCSIVEKALVNVKTNTAAGHDEISGLVLKKLASAIAPNLTSILNKSLAECSFPTKWKMANVRAIYKNKGTKKDPCNYRPISVLPILGRTFEKLAASQLYSYCEAKSIIPNEQYGFRHNSSCEIALLGATDSWLKSMDEGLYVGGLLIDLSKAFDSVPHQILLSELHKIGCTNLTVQWFQSYLAERNQRVVLHEEITNWQTVSRGVPQGSCLSPLLFNIFIRNLPSTIDTDMFQFADDITNYTADESLERISDRLLASFEATREFCKSSELEINTAKTQLIIFKPKGKSVPSDFSLTLDNCIIKPEKTVTLLGVRLDQHLTLGPQIDSIVTKCHGILGVLARAAPFLHRDLLRMTYIALIRSHLEYASALYLPVAETHLKKLDVIERKAARIIFGLPRDAHAAPLLKELKLDSLESRRSARVRKLVGSIIARDCHPAMVPLFNQLQDLSIAVEATRTGLGKRRFSIYGAKLHNSTSFPPGRIPP